MIKKDLPINYTPSIKDAEYVLHYLKGQNKFMLHEKTLNKLFVQLCPDNNCIEDVMIKCSALNDFYSTNILNIHPMAQHILNLKIDTRLKQGDCSLVDDIACITINGKDHRFYSFATKYCSFHQPNLFAIYDSYVEKVLLTMNKRKPFTNEKNLRNNYKSFMSAIHGFQQRFGLTQLSLKELDQYLWQTGKWHFNPYNSLFKYYKGEEQDPFHENDIRGKFWWGEKMFSGLNNQDEILHEYEKDVIEWRTWLQKHKPNQSANLLNSNTNRQLCVVFYIVLLFGKWCPYDNQEWIFEY